MKKIWVGGPAAKAADCKSATLETSKVRFLPGPLCMIVKLEEFSMNLYGFMQNSGVSTKFFGKRLSDGKFGMVKKQVQPNRYDNINEILCFYLGKLFGVNVSEASQGIYNGDNDWGKSGV